MTQMHAVYPDYDFARHKGYATALHRRRLAQHGPCPLHRRSFAPVGALQDDRALDLALARDSSRSRSIEL
jgi:ribonuclease HII